MAVIIVDASVAVKWVVEEADSAVAKSLQGHRLLAPDLLHIECANVLWKKVLRGELPPADVQRRLRTLLKAPVELRRRDQLLAAALALAVELRHPVYDCLYLALAEEAGGQLVSADRRFIERVRRQPVLAERVSLLAELGR
jgi:predicted nucleic acid-binding protein